MTSHQCFDYPDFVIKSFACKETQKIYNGKRSIKLPYEIQQRAFIKLAQLDAATVVQDLRLPPSNQLKALLGNRQGSWSIRINDQWRICFRFEKDGVYDVEITDYH